MQVQKERRPQEQEDADLAREQTCKGRRKDIAEQVQPVLRTAE